MLLPDLEVPVDDVIKLKVVVIVTKRVVKGGSDVQPAKVEDELCYEEDWCVGLVGIASLLGDNRLPADQCDCKVEVDGEVNNLGVDQRNGYVTVRYDASQRLAVVGDCVDNRDIRRGGRHPSLCETFPHNADAPLDGQPPARTESTKL